MGFDKESMRACLVMYMRTPACIFAHIYDVEVLEGYIEALV
jgi:hypothetical protein